MSRLAQVMLAGAIVAFTAAVSVAVAPDDAAARPKDVTPLWIVGVLFLALMFAVDSRRFRETVERVPQLRSPSSRLGEMIDRGNQLTARASRLDRATPDPTWLTDLAQWVKDGEALVEEIDPRRLPWFVAAEADVISYSVPTWAQTYYKALRLRMRKLGELQATTR